MNDGVSIATTVFTGLLAFLGGGGGKWIIDLFRGMKEGSLQEQKQSAELRLTETDKAFTIYKEIVESFKKDMVVLTGQIHTLEHEHLECRETAARQAGRIENLEFQIATLKAELATFEKRA